MEEPMQDPLEGTIFEAYDTVIFDLDGNVWIATNAAGQGIGAFQTTPPYKVEYPGVAVDINGNIITLSDGIDALLKILNGADKNLGIMSSGELEDRPFEAQPAVLLLKLFNIYKYFTYDVVIHKTHEKELYVRPCGKTLFIDDAQENVVKVNEQQQVDVLWRGAFGPWSTLLVPQQAQLQMGLHSPEQVS